jgi:hypothetical protein
VCKINFWIAREFKKRMTESPGDILAVWIESFGGVKLTEDGIDAGIPGFTADCALPFQSRESHCGCHLGTEPFDSRRIEGPICGALKWSTEFTVFSLEVRQRA